VVAARPQIASTLAAATSAAGAASTVAAGAVPAAAPAIAVADAAAVAPPADPTSITLLHLLPHATQIARLALPEVTAGHLIPAESATPIYLRDNVAHVAQPPKPPG
jgi:tRNA A37 threonylcarbamoyladenosine modification protein TsaB